MEKTIELNANISSSKKLVGIANGVSAKSISKWLSGSSQVLSTEQDVRDTKEVSVLIPFLVGVKKVADVLTEAAAGGVKSSKPKVGERIVKLANELITEPLTWRPRDGEVISADALLGKYKEGFITSATVVKDQAYFATIATKGTAGLSTGEKIEVVDTTAAHGAATAEEKGKAFAGLIADATIRIMEHTDGVFQGDFDNGDIAVATTPSIHKYLNVANKYLIKTDGAYATANASSPVQLDGLYDGIHEFKSSKQLRHSKLDFIVMIKGAAVSQFLFMDFMNYDKREGVNAYVLSLEFNEGTGIFFPQLITIGAKTADITSQDAVGSGSIDLMAGVELADTTSTNPA